MNESDVAEFLLAHPAFFERHAELLGRIRLANPHGSRAISLPERQIEMLREKNRQFERRLSELVRYGHENDSNAIKIDRWSARMLTASDSALLPDAVCEGLRDVFDVPQVAVRLWNVAAPFANLAAAAFAGPDMARYADSLTTPYCGPNQQSAAAAWLSEQAGEAGTASIALIPLRPPRSTADAGTFGLLALGAPDPQRFHDGMGTDFLIRIGTLASASLSRLLP